jgi:hypothetical protein
MKKKYLLVFYFKKLNGKHDEFTEFKEHLSNLDMEQAKVILNLTDKAIVKNELNVQADYKTLFKYYRSVNKDKIKEFLSR